MKSLKSLLLELDPGQQPVFNPSLGPPPSADQNQSVELPKLNLVVSVAEKEKKLNFSPIDPKKPTPEARMLINQIKAKFKVSKVQQQQNNVFIITLDPREDIGAVIAYLQAY